MHTEGRKSRFLIKSRYKEKSRRKGGGRYGRKGGGSALWSGTNKNQDVSTGPLALPFARGKVNF